MLPALNEVASQQAKSTADTMKKCLRLLDYATTFPDVYVRFYASDMVLRVDTDTALGHAKITKSHCWIFLLGPTQT